MIQVTVDDGEKQKTFEIYKVTLIHFSPFFGRLLDDNSRGNEIMLPEISADIFGYFVHWLVTQELKTKEGGKLQLIDYAKLFTMTTLFEVPALFDKVLPLCMKHTGPTSEPRNSLRAFQKYAYGQDDDVLKQIAIKKTMSRLRTNNIDLIWEYLPGGMSADLGKALARNCVLLPGWELGREFVSVREVMKKRPAPMLEEDSDESVVHRAKRTPGKRAPDKK